MARRRIPRPVRKRRTREHVIADLAVHHVEGHILRCGFTAERVVHDYGADLTMRTYNVNGEIEPDVVLFQLKATDHSKRAANAAAVLFRLDRVDLDWWLAETFPVILVVYDAQADVGFWLYVQGHFAKMKKVLASRAASVTVRIPLTYVVNQAAIRQIAAIKADIQARMKGARHA